MGCYTSRQIEGENRGKTAGTGSAVRQEGPPGGGNLKGAENLAERTQAGGGASVIGSNEFGIKPNPNDNFELHILPHKISYLKNQPHSFRKRPPILWKLNLTPNVPNLHTQTPICLTMCRKTPLHHYKIFPLHSMLKI